MDLKDSGVDIASFVSEELRSQLYTQEVLSKLTDGTGDLDETYLLHKLPQDLGLSEDKARKVAADLAGERKRLTLVQGVSFFR